MRWTIFDRYQSITASQNHIKQLHGVLLKYSAKDEDHRGEYKKLPNGRALEGKKIDL